MARLPTPVFLAFPCGSAGKESAYNAGDLGSMLGLGRSPGERKGYPFQNSGLENSMNCIVHVVTKSQTWLSDFHFHFALISDFSPHFDLLDFLFKTSFLFKSLQTQLCMHPYWINSRLPLAVDGRQMSSVWHILNRKLK